MNCSRTQTVLISNLNSFQYIQTLCKYHLEITRNFNRNTKKKYLKDKKINTVYNGMMQVKQQ